MHNLILAENYGKNFCAILLLFQNCLHKSISILKTLVYFIQELFVCFQELKSFLCILIKITPNNECKTLRIVIKLSKNKS